MDRDRGLLESKPWFTNQMFGGLWGDAYHWIENIDSNLQGLGFWYDHSPAVGAIAYWDKNACPDCPLGHLAYVEALNPDGTLKSISEYNYCYDHAFDPGPATCNKVLNPPTYFIHVPPVKLTNSAPTVSAVTDSAGFGQKLSPGTLLTIFGQNLSLGTGGVTTLPLPTSLNGTSILIDGISVPIVWTSPTQVNAQLPFEVSVSNTNVLVQVAGMATQASHAISISLTSPGVFTFIDNSAMIGAIEHSDGSQITSTSPAKVGEVIAIYMTGLGATNPPLGTGQPGHGEVTVLTTTVSIGGQSAQVLFSGTSNYPGLYQVNAVTPSLPNGNAQVVVSIGGNSSQPGVMIPIGGSATSQALTASLTASPQNGQTPLAVILTAAAGGTATGTINYTFYCDRSDSGTNITPGYVAKFDTTFTNPETASCTYTNPAAYTAKVIVERGNGAAQAMQTVNATGATLPPPAITSVQPSSASAGPVAQNISIVGTGFQAGLTLTLIPPAGTNQVFSSNQLRNFSSSTFQVSAVLNDAGTWGVRVANPDGQNANAALVIVAQAALKFNFTNWPVVVTVGDPPATLALPVTNLSGGFVSGTASASTSNGGSWLSVDGHDSDTWTIVPSAGLTTGLSLSANPSNLPAGSYTGAIVVNAANASNPTTTVSVSMTVLAPLQIMTASLPDAISGVPYNFPLTGSGGKGVYTWSLQKGVNGTLPNGLSLNPSTGIISGTPTYIAGSNTLTVVIVLQDSLGHSVPKTFSIVWRPGISVSTNQQPNFQFTLGVSYTLNSSPFRFHASGGTPPFTWSGTTMPPGLSVDSTTGTVVGTPSTAGTFPASITATDATGLTGSLLYSFVVVVTPLSLENAGRLPPATLASGTIGMPYDQSIMGSGGSLAGYTWTISGALPSGIVQQRPAGCTPGCGALEFVGIPTQAGSFTFIVTLTDYLSDSTSQLITLVINARSPPTILTTTLSLATVGLPYTFSFKASGGAGGYTWSFVGNPPDPALVLSAGGSLSGISSVANDCFTGPDRWIDSQPPFGYFTPQSFQMKVTDAAGASATGSFCLPSYYPTPQTMSVSPTNVSFTGPPQTMTVTGINFRSNAIVSINGHGYQNTTFVNSTTLTFLVSPGYSNSELTPGSFTLYVVEPYTDMDAGTATFTIQ
jgi:uncharacterized protein (TIGR03437 family)